MATGTWADYLKRRHQQAILSLRRTFLQRLLSKNGLTGSVDEIKQDVPTTVNPVVLGVIPRGLRGILECKGYRSSTDKKTHGRPIKVWTITNRQAAEKWLADHKEADDASSGNIGRADGPDRGSPGHPAATGEQVAAGHHGAPVGADSEECR